MLWRRYSKLAISNLRERDLSTDYTNYTKKKKKERRERILNTEFKREFKRSYTEF